VDGLLAEAAEVGLDIVGTDGACLPGRRRARPTEDVGAVEPAGEIWPWERTGV